MSSVLPLFILANKIQIQKNVSAKILIVFKYENILIFISDFAKYLIKSLQQYLT